MGNLAEQSLGGPELRAMIEELYQLSHDPTLVQVQAALAKRGIECSIMAARSVKKKNFAEYLVEIRRSREQAQLIVNAGVSGEERGGAAAVMLIEQITEQILAARTEGRELDAETLEKTVLNVTRLMTSFQNAKKLKAELELAEKNSRLKDEQIAALEQRTAMQQFDAAKAVLAYTKEIKLVVADTKLDAKAKTERVRAILFGAKPADFRLVTDKGEQAES